MPTGNRLLYVLVLLLASASAIDAHAGVTISDRRYWPNEARGSPRQAIEKYPHSYVYPGIGLAAEPRTVPHRKAKRAR